MHDPDTNPLNSLLTQKSLRQVTVRRTSSIPAFSLCGVQGRMSKDGKYGINHIADYAKKIKMATG